MITLNKDHGPVDVKSWEEVTSLPGFVNDLDRTKHNLDSVIGRYLFKDKILCGLSECHTPHNKGYVVKTKEGLITNIGKDCGRKYFSVDFEKMAKQYDRDMNAYENRNRLTSFNFGLDEFEDSIYELRHKEKGADWVHKSLKRLMDSKGDCPEQVVRKLVEMVKARSTILTIQHEANAEEIEQAEARLGRRVQRPYVIEEPVAEILGIMALYEENDVRKILILDIEENLKAFKAIDIDSMSYENLVYWVKWVNSLDKKIELIISAISAANTLLAFDNLWPFEQMLDKSDQKVIFKKLLKSF